ncbi:WD40 repeat-like protein [Penicillium malachiteum]|uniref:WD40 repeat-like protein n=1 Tax=Penicillium malachiteum TaxID=1324776 RepID=UPI00254773EA|nr:WD40 repeat-like protein [Penicillium malachiteum]KAJ5720474.1 WD40 repeat-like protein [Penicillium malachiteum]
MAPPPQAGASPYAPIAAAQPPPPNPYASAPPPPAAAVPPPPRAQVPPPPQGARPGLAQSQAAAPPPPAASKYPAGDRSHIPPNAMPIYEILNPKIQFLEPRAPEKFKKQTQRSASSLNEIFDRLNNETFKPETVSKLVGLAQAVEARRYDVATKIHSDLLVNNNDEYSSLQIGVKYLIQMCSATWRAEETPSQSQIL